MSFLRPKVPKPVPAPTPPTPAQAPLLAKEFQRGAEESPNFDGSLISTSTRGLKRKANTERTSLLGGY